MKNKIIRKKDFIQKTLTYKNRNEEIRILSEIVNTDYLDTIKHSLSSRGIQPANLADTIGVSRSYISQVLNGTRMLNINFITRIRRAYGIPLELVDTSRYYSNMTLVVFQPKYNLNQEEIINQYNESNTIDIPFTEYVSVNVTQKRIV